MFLDVQVEFVGETCEMFVMFRTWVVAIGLWMLGTFQNDNGIVLVWEP